MSLGAKVGLGAAIALLAVLAWRLARPAPQAAVPPATEVAAAPAAPAAHATPSVHASHGEVIVYKSPTCGCCSLWVDHLRDNGFQVVAKDMSDVTPVKARLGVPAALGSCHTATIGGYTIEGHVPADLIARLLRERPPVAGLAVPGMPSGSPGMEGGRKDPYDVLTFTRDGKTAVYAKR